MPVTHWGRGRRGQLVSNLCPDTMIFGPRMDQTQSGAIMDGALEPAGRGLAWMLHKSVVTAPIIGPRTVEQLESAVRATEIALEATTQARLDEVFPGPGGEAPTACAW